MIRLGRPLSSSTAIVRWSQANCVEWHYIASGKPMQTAFVESFSGDGPALQGAK